MSAISIQVGGMMHYSGGKQIMQEHTECQPPFEPPSIGFQHIKGVVLIRVLGWYNDFSYPRGKGVHDYK